MSFDLSYRFPALLRKIVRNYTIKKSESNINYKIVELNKMPKVKGPALYVGNHTTASDILILEKLIKKQCYVMLGKQRLDEKSELYFSLIGTIRPDRENTEEGKISRKQSLDATIKCIKNKISVMIFPEVTWCVMGAKHAREDLNEANPINHMKWGVVKAAKETGAPIIVSTMEYIGDTCYILHSGPIYVTKEMSDEEVIHNIEGIVIESKIKIQKQFSKIDNYNMPEFEHRELIAKLEKENDETIEKRYDDFPSLEPEKEKSCIFNPYEKNKKTIMEENSHKYDSPEIVFGHSPDAKERLIQFKKELSLVQQQELETQEQELEAKQKESEENRIKI